MQINSVSPSFKGFIRIFSDSNDPELVNTSNVLDFNSSVSKTDESFFNSVTYAGTDGNIKTVSSFHPEYDGIQKRGYDFERSFARICHKADTTGEIVNIII